MIETRFTLDGSEALERHLDRTCGQVLTQVQTIVPRRKLRGLVLGGGYGRGEGGVLGTVKGDQPYNDLEFYVFVRGSHQLSERIYGSALRDLGRRLSSVAGLHVEFKIDSLDHLRRSPVSIFTYDLVAAHRSLFGGELFNRCEHHLQAGVLPLSEASRLLFNRCTGLLLARELLAGPKPQTPGSRHSVPVGQRSLSQDEADFVGRNLAKAQLCLGDAMLVAFRQYHWSCRERQHRLRSLAPPERIAWLEEVRDQHSVGVQFKLHPIKVWKSVLEFEREHRRISALCLKVWLWLENRRLGSGFTSIRDYAFHRPDKFPGHRSWRNYVLNLKTFGIKAALSPVSWRYPRERLFNALSLLLWSAPDSNQPETVRHLQKQLVTGATDWLSLVSVYKQIWPRYG